MIFSRLPEMTKWQFAAISRQWSRPLLSLSLGVRRYEYQTDYQTPAAFGEDRRAMPKEQRLEVETYLRKEGFSQREIADTLGVTKATVTRDLNGPNGPHEPEPDACEDATTGSNGPPAPEPEPELAAEGFSQREIADTLGVSEGTVRNDIGAQNCAPEPAPDAYNEPPAAQNCAPEPEPEPETAGEEAGGREPERAACAVPVRFFGSMRPQEGSGDAASGGLG